jgi:hypothetical protein
MRRHVGILVTGAAAALLFAGVAQAVKPVAGTPAGQAFVAYSDPNSAPAIPAIGAPAQELIELALPADGKFMVTATLLVGNLSSTDEAFVSCNLFYGPGLTVGTWLDWADTRLPPGNNVGASSDKFTLTGFVERTAAPSDQVLRIICAANGNTYARYLHLSAVSVSSITR